MEYIRNCPGCKIELSYATRATFNKAVRRNAHCRECSPMKGKKIDKSKALFVAYRNCPKCGKELKHTSSDSQYSADYRMRKADESKKLCLSCFNSRPQAVGVRSPNWKGFGNISNTIFSKFKNGAEERELPFSITIQDMDAQWNSQNGKCAYTGEQLVGNVKNYMHNKKMMTASLDRIDSSKGYTKDNIQWVLKDINMMKQQLKENKFLGLCNSVVGKNNAMNILCCP